MWVYILRTKDEWIGRENGIREVGGEWEWNEVEFVFETTEKIKKQQRLGLDNRND